MFLPVTTSLNSVTIKGKQHKYLNVKFDRAASGVDPIGHHFEIDVRAAMDTAGAFADGFAMGLGCTPVLHLKAQKAIITGAGELDYVDAASGDIIANQGLVIGCQRSGRSAYFKNQHEKSLEMTVSGLIYLWVDGVLLADQRPFDILSFVLSSEPLQFTETQRLTLNGG